MTAVLVALIGALGVVLAAVIPALLVARRAKGAADDAKGAADAACEASTSAKNTIHDRSTTVEALLFRLEGKVDSLAEDVRTVLEWRSVHDEKHRHLHAVPVLAAEEVILRVQENYDHDHEDDLGTALGHA